MSDDEFVFDWTGKLGFKDNPFTTDVLRPVEKFYSGYKDARKEFNLFVLEKHPFGTISGKEGQGKTTSLRWVAAQLKKHRDKVVVSYVNAAELEKERDLIKGLAKPLLNFYEKNVLRKHEKLRLEELGKFIYSKLKGEKNLLIMLDDVGRLPKRYISLFKYFFDNEVGVQLVAADTEDGLKDSNIRRVAEDDWLDIKLSGLSHDEMAEMLRKRIEHFGQEDIYPFQDDMLADMYDESDGNPSEFLQLCRKKAVKLSLDKEYIEEERKKAEEKRKARMEEEESKDLVSIKLGGGKEEPEEDELDELLEAPDEEQQEEMLEEARREEMGDEEILDEDESEGEKGDKKRNEKAKETEDFLSQLTEEFED